MFELLITACIAGDPAQCLERRLPFYEPMNMMRCMRHGLNHAQSWADSHPDMALKKWRCVEELEEREAAEFGVEEVAPGVFVHTGAHETPTPENGGDLANLGFIIGEDAVAIVDAGGSAQVAMKLLSAIRARTDLPVQYLILTHMHPDHSLGASVIRDAGAEVIGHRKLERAILARAQTYEDNIRRLIGDEAYEGTEIMAPESGVEGIREIDLGGRVIVLEAHPTAHTDNDLTVLDRKTGTWFLGDLLFAGHTPALDGSINGWLSLLDELRGREVSRVVPGHGPASLPWPDALAPLEAYLLDIAEGTRAAIRAGETMQRATETVGEDQRGLWVLFDEFNKRNVTSAYKELEWE